MITAIAQRLEVYKCEKCGHIVEILHGGAGTLSCCDTPMKLFKENTVDAAREKHIPVIEKTTGGYLVKVGSVAHPMTDEHSIEWIELVADGVVYRAFLNPGEAPEASFNCQADAVYARAYCNLHGLWKGE